MQRRVSIPCDRANGWMEWGERTGINTTGSVCCPVWSSCPISGSHGRILSRWVTDGRCDDRRLGRVKLKEAKFSCCAPGLPVRGPWSPWSPRPPSLRPGVSESSSSPNLFWEDTQYLRRIWWAQPLCRDRSFGENYGTGSAPLFLLFLWA